MIEDKIPGSVRSIQHEPPVCDKGTVADRAGYVVVRITRAV